MFTQQEIETYLDKGMVWAAMRNGRYWKVRRNGRTQTWKTRPGEFRIPIKAGLKSYGEITHTFRENGFVIAERDPNI